MCKKYICAICSKGLSNRHSLSRHKNNYCKGISNPSKSSMFQSKNSKGSKIEVLADALINNKSSKNDLPRDRRMEVDGDMQRTKADILGYNDDDDDDDDAEEEDEEEEEV